MVQISNSDRNDPSTHVCPGLTRENPSMNIPPTVDKIKLDHVVLHTVGDHLLHQLPQCVKRANIGIQRVRLSMYIKRMSQIITSSPEVENWGGRWVGRYTIYEFCDHWGAWGDETDRRR